MRTSKWTLSILQLLLISNLTLVFGWDPQPDGYELIDGPDAGQSTAEWLDPWRTWREKVIQTNRYDPTDDCVVYNAPSTQWSQSSFIQGYVMMFDRAIYDRKTNTYKVDEYVNAMKDQIGGIESVLLWPHYPNIGIDNRNQFDMFRTLPKYSDNLDAVTGLVRGFHAHGIKVFLPYNPWDVATRDETGREDMVRWYQADIETIYDFLHSDDLDALNGDTMYGIPTPFYNCSDPQVLSPEGGVPNAYIGINAMSWGYFWGYNNFPPVSKAKFLESRHMVQQCARWSVDKVKDVQIAFFNGGGYVNWENIWGIWNGNTKREDEAIRRAFAILRKVSWIVTSDKWTPYDVRNDENTVVGTRFESEDGSTHFIPIISSASDGNTTIRVPLSSNETDMNAFDMYYGKELVIHNDASNGSYVEVTVEPEGFEAVLLTRDTSKVPDLDTFLASMREMTQNPLSNYSNDRPYAQQTLQTSQATVDNPSLEIQDGSVVDMSNATTTGSDREGMVYVSGADEWLFNVSGVQIEPVPEWTPTYLDFGTGVQFPWEDRPWNNHSHVLKIKPFYLDRHPVTNKQYFDFLAESGYEPSDLDYFLAHWENRMEDKTNKLKDIHDWKIPFSFEDRPVVNVALEDAQAYASFYHKRLPHDWEWQYVASNGHRYTKYPWGDDFAADKVPPVDRSKNPPPPASVLSNQVSQSLSFGAQDLVGYIWQMTDSFCDDHTCGLLLRGGSYYHPIAFTGNDPNWYFPQAMASDKHNRWLMIGESYDRSPFIGFRCAQDS